MLSIKSALDITGALRRAVSILLDGISVNVFPCGTPDRVLFQGRVKKLRGQFDDAGTPDSVLFLAGDAIRCIEEYGAAAEEFMSARGRGQQQTTGLLLNAFIRISKGNPDTLGKLRTISGELERASGTDDIAALNKSLAECIHELESRPQEEDEVAESHAADVDIATGLPGVQSAIAAIRAAGRANTPCHVLAFGVDRLETINLRFGFRAGDQILLLFAQHVAQHLAPQDTLYRWRGPCFVVLTERTDSASGLAAEASKIAHSRLEHTITKGEREIVVPVAASSALFTIPSHRPVDETLERLDEFAIHRTALRHEA
jgi:diguanylate cyclase (GGDEF)-like protein